MLKEMEMFQEDWIGLRTLYESNRLFFYSGKGTHMKLEQEMITDYLAPLILEKHIEPSEY